MKTREQNRNNKRKEIERFDWFLKRIQTRVRFDWLKERSGEKTLCPRTRVKNAVRMRACFRREFACASPNRNYTRYQNKLDSGREIQKSKLPTRKISLEFHEHKVY